MKFWVPYKQELVWRFGSSGVLLCVGWYVVKDVSKDCCAIVFVVVQEITLKMTLRIFDTSVSIYRSKRSNIPEDLNLDRHRCQKLTSRWNFSTDWVVFKFSKKTLYCGIKLDVGQKSSLDRAVYTAIFSGKSFLPCIKSLRKHSKPACFNTHASRYLPSLCKAVTNFLCHNCK
jgi:transposase-like protein